MTSPVKPHLLLVDDTPENIDLLVEMLGPDYELSVATDGASALEATEDQIPDLILLDIMMPGMDGYETLKHLKENLEWAAIPVIFLTAKNQNEDLLLGFQLGAVDFITKPFNLAELQARIRTHIDLALAMRVIEKQKIELEAVNGQLAVANNEQKELLHVLCHDLVNPLGSINSFAKLMQTDPDTVAMGLELIEGSSQQGLDIIDLIRRMRAMEEYEVELTSWKVAEVIENSLKQLKLKLEAKKQEVKLSLEPGLEVLAEPSSLVHSVLNNLLTNAIKFSYPQQTIEVRGVKKGEQVRLEIEDHGIGIPPTLLANLFQINKKTSRLGTGKEEGTGFGMPLVEKFMRLYGGEIEVESTSIEENQDHHGTVMRLIFQAG